MGNKIVIDGEEIEYKDFYVGNRKLTLDSTTPMINFIIKDGVTYNLNDDEQALAYNEAYNETDGWMKDMVLTKNVNNGYREYKVSDLSSTPTHPNRDDFGYENLKSGSTIYDVVTKKLYMFDEITNNGIGEWVLQ